MKPLSAILYKTDGTQEPFVLTKETKLETIQDMIGGYIEVIHILDFEKSLKGNFKDGKDLIINEEGFLLDLPINPWSAKVGLNSIWKDEEFRGNMVLIDGRLT